MFSFNNSKSNTKEEDSFSSNKEASNEYQLNNIPQFIEGQSFHNQKTSFPPTSQQSKENSNTRSSFNLNMNVSKAKNVNKGRINQQSFIANDLKSNIFMEQIKKEKDNKQQLSNFNIKSNITINLNTYVSKGGDDANLFNPFSIDKKGGDDNIMKFIRDEKIESSRDFSNEHNKSFYDENEEEVEGILLKEKEFGKENCKIIYHNQGNEQNNKADKNKTEEVNQKIKMYSKYTVNRYRDLGDCINSSYFTNVFKGINMNMTNSNQDEMNLQTGLPSQSMKIQINNQNKISKYQNIIEENIKQNIKLQKQQPKSLIITNETFFSAKIRIIKRQDPYKFTLYDVIYFNNKVINLTNSIIYYLNNFFNKEKFYIFPIHEVNSIPISIKEQNYQCYMCMKRFEFILFFPIEKIHWCSFLMKYVCSDCIAEDYSIIPAFVLTNWNFGKYPISKFGKNIIKQWETKPVIHIKYKNPIVSLSSLLKQSLVLKRKIHKIFDLMKCSYDEFIGNVLGEYKYLVFKENYFSLNDLCEINNYSFIIKLHDFVDLFEKHILQDCEKCRYKGGICFICNKDEVLYAYNIESTIYCNDCKKIFHKKCASFHPCLVEKRY